MSKVRGILLNVKEGYSEVVEIQDGNRCEKFYKLLDCNTIDIVVRTIAKKQFSIVCDDEGLMKERVKISALSDSGKALLVGNLFICKNDGPVLTSLTDEDIEHIRKNILRVFGYPTLVRVGYPARAWM